LNYPATLHSFRSCLKVIDTFRWVRSPNQVFTDHRVQLGGKTLRHSFNTASGKDAVRILYAWWSDLQVCLGQVAVDQDSNEIRAVPKLLVERRLSLAILKRDTSVQKCSIRVKRLQAGMV
jgi:hypothetical protein